VKTGEPGISPATQFWYHFPHVKIDIKTILKATLSFGLLAFLFYRTDSESLVRVMASTNWLMLVPAAIILFSTTLLQNLRWSIILRNFDLHVEYFRLFRIVLIGCFFNLFLPSSVGGDFFRAWYLGKHEKTGVSLAATTTLIDRISGLSALMILGLFCSFFSHQSLGGVQLRVIFMAIFLVFMTGIVMFFHPVLHRVLERFLIKVKAVRIAGKLPPIYEGAARFRKNIPDIALTTGLSLVIQVISISSVWVAARAMNIDAPFLVFLIFVPLINIAVAVPLTINGVGLREGMYYLLFSSIGVPMEESITLSLVTMLLYVSMALPGGFVYSVFKREENFSMDPR